MGFESQASSPAYEASGIRNIEEGSSIEMLQTSVREILKGSWDLVSRL